MLKYLLVDIHDGLAQLASMKSGLYVIVNFYQLPFFDFGSNESFVVTAKMNRVLANGIRFKIAFSCSSF